MSVRAEQGRQRIGDGDGGLGEDFINLSSMLACLGCLGSDLAKEQPAPA